MKLFDDSAFTHMPFVFENRLLHCKAHNRAMPDGGMGDGNGSPSEYQAYDIHCSDLDGRNSVYISAGLGEDVIVCSPNAYRDLDGSVVLNYVALCMNAADRRYLHYRRRGPSLESLGAPTVVPEPQGILNYCQSENLAYAYTVFRMGAESLLWQYDKTYGRRQAFRFGNLAQLKRAVVLDESSVVLTYISAADEVKSALFDTESFLLMDIKVDGKDVYKSHLHDGTAYFSVRAPGDVYGMAIHRGEYALTPSTLRARGSGWLDAPAATRRGTNHEVAASPSALGSEAVT